MPEEEKNLDEERKALELEELRERKVQRDREGQLQMERDQEEGLRENAEMDRLEQQKNYNKSLRGKARNTASKAASIFKKKKPEQAGDDSGDGGGGSEEATGKGKSPISPENINIFTKQSKSKFWLILAFILLCAYLIYRYVQQTLTLEIILKFTAGAGFILFVGYGFLSKPQPGDGDKTTRIFIAITFIIWLMDFMNWNFQIPGTNFRIHSPFEGFELIPWTIIRDFSIPSILASGLLLGIMYLQMVYRIIKRDWWFWILCFIFIVATNRFLSGIGFFNINLSLYYPTLSWVWFIAWILTIAAVVGLFYAVRYLKSKKTFSDQAMDFFTSLLLYFVGAFFFINTGWTYDLIAVIHFFFIIFFGYGYVKKKESNNPLTHLIIVAILLIDFFGTAFLKESGILFHNALWLIFIPPLVVFVIFYCYARTKDNYAIGAFVLLVTLILIMAIDTSNAYPSGNVQFNPVSGTPYTNFLKEFFGKTQKLIETQLTYASGGYYGAVEQNKYESLGVYFANIRGADPKFFNDEPITIWGTLRAKSYHDAVIVNFSCYRIDKDKLKIYADRIIPETRFPVFSLDNIDTECTFLPHQGEEIEIKPGTNVVTFSAEYNFNTDAYLKNYFIDRDRFKANLREDVNPLDQFGITDKNPITVYTNGPVEIGMESSDSLVKVSPGFSVKPSIGISLRSRSEISDKDKKIISKWEGKIKALNELVILTPPGITIGSQKINDINPLDACKLPDDDKDKKYCPCNAPFKIYTTQDCLNTCKSLSTLCESTCDETYKGTTDDVNTARNNCKTDCGTSQTKCNTECGLLFNVEQADTDSTNKNIQGSYNGYQLDLENVKIRNSENDQGKYLSFKCRYDIDTQLLFDSTPITTRYFRARARYNYTTENSVNVAVQESPTPSVEAEKEFPTVIKTTTYTPSNIDIDFYLKGIGGKPSPMVGLGQCINGASRASGIPPPVIIAIAGIESSYGRAVLRGSNSLFNIQCHNTYDRSSSRCPFQDKSDCCGEYKGTYTDDNGNKKTFTYSFRKYVDFCDSVNDFVDFLPRQSRYNRALTYTNDHVIMVTEIGNAGYVQLDQRAQWIKSVTSIVRDFNAKVTAFRQTTTSSSSKPTESSQITSMVTTLGQCVKDASQSSGVPQIVIFGFAGQETTYGTNVQAGKNNIFGIKCSGYPTCTGEWRDYNTPCDSVNDFANVIKSRYPAAMQNTNNPETMAQQIAHQYGGSADTVIQKMKAVVLVYPEFKY